MPEERGQNKSWYSEHQSWSWTYQLSFSSPVSKTSVIAYFELSLLLIAITLVFETGEENESWYVQLQL